jgi:hypothetical protein
MSTIDLRTSGHLRFRARWTEPDGTHRAKHFAARDEAAAFLDSIDQALAAGTYRPPRTGRALVRAYARYWLASQHVRPATRERNTFVVDKRIVPRFGRLPLNAVHPADVQAWVNDLVAEGLAPVTITLIRDGCWVPSCCRPNGIASSTTLPCTGIRHSPNDDTGVLRPCRWPM